jgi:DNA ligase (NAD+)
VVIQRAGEVIPEIVEPIVSRRTGKEKIFHMPKRCPVCGAEVIKPEGEAMHRCTNAACPAQALERIKHFVGRVTMDIEGIGDRMSQALFDAGLVKDVGDIYSITRDQLLKLEKIADKSAANILNSIERSKDRPLPRVIFALGIPNIGDQTAELLAEHFSSIDELSRASKEQLQEIPSIGPKIADSILAFFRQKQNLKIIEKLRNASVKLEAEKSKRGDLPLAGLEFVITGRLESLPREAAEAKIKELGGKAGSDVTRKTSYLVVGEDPGSKLARAQAVGTKTLTEIEFLKLLKQAEDTLK